MLESTALHAREGSSLDEMLATAGIRRRALELVSAWQARCALGLPRDSLHDLQSYYDEHLAPVVGRGEVEILAGDACRSATTSIDGRASAPDRSPALPRASCDAVEAPMLRSVERSGGLPAGQEAGG